MLTPFGKEVRKLRIDRGMTLKSLADGINVSSAYLSSVETGNKNVNNKLVEQISAVMGLDIDEASRLRHAAEISAKDITMELKNKSDKEREVATQFARRFSELNSQDLDEVLEVLHKRQRSD